MGIYDSGILFTRSEQFEGWSKEDLISLASDRFHIFTSDKTKVQLQQLISEAINHERFKSFKAKRI